MLDIDRIVSMYKENGNMKEIERYFKISGYKVKKILSSEGVYKTKRGMEITELFESGKTADEIAKNMNVSRSCVCMYLPYTKDIIGVKKPTKNALRIRKCRAHTGRE